MIRLLIVDDSALMRRLFVQVFAAEGDFETQTAADGAEALDRLAAFRPDVVTLDLRMPGLDGLACLDRIMVERPTPVVVVSGATRAGADETLRALQLGAVEVIAKPAGALSLKMHEFGPRLVRAARAAAGARLSPVSRLAERVRARVGAIAPAPPRRRSPRADRQDGVVVIGASTGGPAALDAVLAALPASFPWPVLIAQHMPASFTGALARRLDALTPLSVRETSAPTPLAGGCVYVARGDADLIVERRDGAAVALAAPPDESRNWHPSVDRLTESVMAHFEPARIVGVLLTGMGDDGAAAMTALRAAGGATIAEAQSTAVIWGMPGELVRAGGAQWVEPLERIGSRLADLVGAA